MVGRRETEPKRLWRVWGVISDLWEKIELTTGTWPRIKGVETLIRDVEIKVP